MDSFGTRIGTVRDAATGATFASYSTGSTKHEEEWLQSPFAIVLWSLKTQLVTHKSDVPMTTMFITEPAVLLHLRF